MSYRYKVQLQTERDKTEGDSYEYISEYLLYEGEPNGDYLESKDNLDDMYIHFFELFGDKIFVILDYELQQERKFEDPNQKSLF